MEIEVGDRKVWLSKIRGAYQLGVELMTEALQEALPDDAIRNVNSRLEWFYLYERTDDQSVTDGEATDGNGQGEFDSPDSA